MIHMGDRDDRSDKGDMSDRGDMGDRGDRGDRGDMDDKGNRATGLKGLIFLTGENGIAYFLTHWTNL